MVYPEMFVPCTMCLCYVSLNNISRFLGWAIRLSATQLLKANCSFHPNTSIIVSPSVWCTFY